MLPDRGVQVGIPKNKKETVQKIHRFMYTALNNVVCQSHCLELFQTPIAA